jgi:methylmalonyl-CoA mutase N-terminal domain/subunit
VRAIESGYVQQMIADASYRLQLAVERGERIRVGVNAYQEATPATVKAATRPQNGLDDALASLARARAERDPRRVKLALEDLGAAADAGRNTMPAMLEAVRAYASVGEICDVLRGRWGTYRDGFVL